MLMVILNVVYVLVAVAMIALILLQRGAGAAAGSDRTWSGIVREVDVLIGLL